MKHPRGGIDRRQFLAGAGLSAWLAATHGSGVRAALRGAGDGAAGDAGPGATTAGRGGAGRIRSLRLETAAPLAEMERFYGGLLGLGLEQRPGELTVRAGETPITFVGAGPAGGAPFYHFAFNVPENKILAARDWQLERTPLIPPYANLRDPQLPDDVVHFRSWNAHSVFFWDPAGNLLEHIARHDLDNASGGAFDSSDILYASEIGLIVDDVPALAADLESAFGLSPYRPGSGQFTAVGDELGLLLAMKRGRNLGFGEGRPAGVFATGVALRGGAPARYAPAGYPFEVVSA